MKFASQHVGAVTESEGWAHLMRAAPMFATQIMRAAAGLPNDVPGKSPAGGGGGGGDGGGGSGGEAGGSKRRRTTYKERV